MSLTKVSAEMCSSCSLPFMNRPDPPDSLDEKPEQSQPSLSETIDRANRAIEGSRASIARSQALGRSVADLNREIKQVRKEESDASCVQKDQA